MSSDKIRERMNPSAYQTFSAFAFPLVLIPVSALIKKIVRGRSSFRLDDFYLGLDLTLAAFSLAAVNVIEINPNGRVNLGWYFVVTLIVLRCGWPCTSSGPVLRLFGGNLFCC